ncbi:MAG TPA: hypothetical protein IAB45_01685 [Candidatus Onthousia faecavium]|nr:hypothetical protein [Candidatus Onthousia faecavium]
MNKEENIKIVENVLASFEMDAIRVPEEAIDKVMKKLNIKCDKLENSKQLVLKKERGN